MKMNRMILILVSLMAVQPAWAQLNAAKFLAGTNSPQTHDSADDVPFIRLDEFQFGMEIEYEPGQFKKPHENICTKPGVQN